ncbi:glycoside hydrolase family 89 protein [Xylaria intraflava]|nr:glycoside hydrolase family 89 protein [Xylaria intraflava]
MRVFNPVVWALAAVGVAATISTAGVESLVRRRLPHHAESFQFKIVNAVKNETGTGVERENDSYVVSSTKNGKILVQGNSVSALLSGLRAYMSTEAHVDIWWYIGSQLDQAPAHLPALSHPLVGTSVVPYRYYLNTVTTSYTSAFWGWNEWEEQLDWMALHGVNIALAWIGFEKVYLEVFREMGLSDPDILEFISGPAFLAWNHFGNIQSSWGGLMPESWIESQSAMQKKIVQRMVELGITPILPAFTGFTPRAFPKVFPSANVTNGSTFNNFPVEYTNDTFLDPLSPLFTELQTRFVAKQQSYYGNVTHFWTLDQFNENDPASGDLDYLESVSSNTWKSLQAADPEAIWVMQGWLFSANAAFWTTDRIQAFLGGVPDTSAHNFLILDLFAESEPQWPRTNSFFGKPWIWCQIHDYGGNDGMYGQIMNVTVNSTEALAVNDKLVGFGLTPEGLEGNEIMYDLLLDQAWSKTPIDTEQYFHDWAAARYGASGARLPNGLFEAWEMVRPTVYNNTNLVADAVSKSVFELLPSTSGMLNRTGHHPTVLNYDPAVLVKAWNLMHQAGLDEPKLFSNPAYQYDLVDWTRQVLANAFRPIYEELVAIYTSQDQKTRLRDLKSQGKQLTDLLLTLDGILATNENFRLSTWINAARATVDPSDPNHEAIADFLEYEARNQVTLWGPTGQITDYGSRGWSGLVKDYYVPRWQKFVDYLIATPPASYNQTAFNSELLAWEISWVNQTTKGHESHEPTRDLRTVLAKAIHTLQPVFAV